MSLSQQLAPLVPNEVRLYIDAIVNERVAEITAKQELHRSERIESALAFRNDIESMRAQLSAIQAALNMR